MLENKLCAYIDIIGWREATTELSAEFLLEVLNLLHQESTVFNSSTRSQVREMEAAGKIRANPIFLETKISAFSDNIVLSMPVNFGNRIFSIGRLCNMLLPKGLLTRGAITVGNLYHEDNLVFGEALNHAVKMEQTTSMPRIECSTEVIDLLGHDSSFKDYTVIDSEGKTIVNPYHMPFVVEDIQFARNFIDGNWYLLEVLKITQKEIIKWKGDDKKLKKWKYIYDQIKNNFFVAYPEIIKPYINNLRH